ncbi:OLC1v1019882C1 [Oldenlandia corymbosa var. corymbosa]|uniref:OLC1v1019882C1 n=1 Tax=Oldenlandia corymbosa var. corymbosa TaxID=529605 RepID=A0AAV1EF50_OLDCO|nr:OLC1v1019882C1 [Oldenlandia corymbosa var. corymbosa]
MAGLTTLSALPLNSVPKTAQSKCESCQTTLKSSTQPSSAYPIFSTPLNRIKPRRLCAGLSEIEPDLNEDFVDRWRTNGIDEADFIYGKYDDHHTFYEGEQKKGAFWSTVAEEYESIGPPKGFQGFISWIFLPAIAAGMYFNVPGEYLYIGAAVFVSLFCVIEMDKPSEAHNFEPQIYNMERGARDKLINDYNTMDIWDFNEKYGDLWDFTIKKEPSDIMKR